MKNAVNSYMPTNWKTQKKWIYFQKHTAKKKIFESKTDILNIMYLHDQKKKLKYS